MDVKSYRDLIVWQKSMNLVVDCYEISKGFPKDEMFGLSSQLKRSAVSIPANIAEGHGRNSLGEYIQFLGIAQGSLRETETHLLIALRLNFANESNVNTVLGLAEEISKMLGALIRGLKAKKSRS